MLSEGTKIRFGDVCPNYGTKGGTTQVELLERGYSIIQGHYHRFIIMNKKKNFFNKDKFCCLQELRFEKNIVRLQEVPVNEINNRNLYGFDKNGEIIWQIEDLTTDGHDSLFTNIERVSNRLLGYTWDGWRFEIDPYTGKILSKLITK